MFDITQIKIPLSSGCYIMKNKAQKIIYIGKAKSLRKRVRSYFRGAHDSKTTELVRNIAEIDFIVTDSELEALLLEAKLIFKHKPQFNLALKNSERYAYIKITNEEFPRIISARQVNREKDTFYGPYPDGTARRETVATLNKIFQLRTCRRLPKSVCLLYHIGQCTAPCESKISVREYSENVKRAEFVLQGKSDELEKRLTKEMNDFANNQKYEQAKIRRDQIYAIQKITERQKVSLKNNYNQDFWYYVFFEKHVHIQSFNVQKGLIGNREHFSFDYDGDNFSHIIQQFFEQYYYSHDIPDEIVLPEPLEEHELLQKYLHELKGKKVTITIPQRGVKKQLLDLLQKNVELNASYEDGILIELQKKLNLHTIPRRIECFDISNIGPRFTVGAMISFLNGKPDKKNYRRFKIKTVSGQNDFAMMAEVVRRRYTRLIKEQAEMPDLIIIDGGPGQLGAAFAELNKLELKVPMISLAKKEEIVHFIGERRPLRMSHKSDALKLLQRCRDEAHRFGITYHRLLRSKGMLEK